MLAKILSKKKWVGKMKKVQIGAIWHCCQRCRSFPFPKKKAIYLATVSPWRLFPFHHKLCVKSGVVPEIQEPVGKQHLSAFIRPLFSI